MAKNKLSRFEKIHALWLKSWRSENPDHETWLASKAALREAEVAQMKASNLMITAAPATGIAIASVLGAAANSAAYSNLTSETFSPSTDASQIKPLPEDHPHAPYVNEAIANQKPADKVVTQTQSYKLVDGVFKAVETKALPALPAKEQSINIAKFNSEVQVLLQENINHSLKVAEVTGGIAALALAGAFFCAAKSRKYGKVIDRIYDERINPAPTPAPAQEPA